jgi:diacylglycerol kinase family enzyme
VDENVDCIVACGGDGTVNEVARCLVGTSVLMGILPIGSGNGLARHLCLPADLTAALDLLKTRSYKQVDVGQVNGRYFFSNLSVAFSARVIHCYDELAERGIKGYYRAFFRALASFRYTSFELYGDSQPILSTPFILMVSNTAQLGYDHSLTPDASLFDGKLDVIRVERSHPFRLGLFMILALLKRFPPYVNVNRFQVQQITIRSQGDPINMQVDGEKIEMEPSELHISILPAALKVVC